MKTWEFLNEFKSALHAQLIEDDKRWGDTWREREIGGQETRIFAHLADYYDQWKNAGMPIPWLKVAGLAFIAWIRETQGEKIYK